MQIRLYKRFTCIQWNRLRRRLHENIEEGLMHSHTVLRARHIVTHPSPASKFGKRNKFSQPFEGVVEARGLYKIRGPTTSGNSNGNGK
jgi:hypothetical protein